MLIVPARQLQEGMVLAAPLPDASNPGQVWLPRGTVLRAPSVRRLHQLGHAPVYVECAGLEALDAHLAVHLTPHSPGLAARLRETVDDLTHAGRRAHLRFEEHYRRVRSLTAAIQRLGPSGLHYDQSARQSIGAVTHPIAVAHLSLLLGLRLSAYVASEQSHLPPAIAKDVAGLGVAAALHDLGKPSLPDELQGRHVADPPSAQHFERWEEHAKIGFETIEGKVESAAAEAVRQHHLRFDGRTLAARPEPGSIRRPSGRGIHVFARILAAADLYDRLAHPAVGIHRSNLEIFHLINMDFDGCLDPVVLRALVEIAPPFLPGTQVQLADGSRAVVVHVFASQPLFPIVRLMTYDRRAVTGAPLDLSGGSAPDIATANDLPVPRFLTNCDWWAGRAA